MLIRMIGIAIAFGAAVLAGAYVGNLDNFRIRDLTQMKKALAILKAEIEFAHAPLPEALMGIAQRTAGPIGAMFLMLAERIDTDRGADVSQLWAQCVLTLAPETYFNNEDVEQFIAFGKTLGFLDKGMQIANIAIATDYINEKMVRLNESRFKSGRMYRSLGFLGGLLIVVIFL